MKTYIGVSVAVGILIMSLYGILIMSLYMDNVAEQRAEIDHEKVTALVKEGYIIYVDDRERKSNSVTQRELKGAHVEYSEEKKEIYIILSKARGYNSPVIVPLLF